ncbi:hypothetical protein CMZ82_16095 [Lysobacteraceae bacterium NML93-0792]|nr:hypothetical protein CMZ82_16095 [Xanthomonadaceae bacterium NML93-0792]PBS15026.1 hypothetical protein CMZ81_12800 [Xanthomonadaceae bacterium NML93-0793]
MRSGQRVENRVRAEVGRLRQIECRETMLECDITAELAHPGRHTVPCRDVEDILARIGRRAACRAVGGIADRRLSVRTRLPQIVERDLPAQPVEAGGIEAGVG